MSTHILTTANAVDIADEIAETYNRDDAVTVNGMKLTDRASHVVTSWQNGSVSIRVDARTTRGTRDEFFRVGTKIVIESVA